MPRIPEDRAACSQHGTSSRAKRSSRCRHRAPPSMPTTHPRTKSFGLPRRRRRVRIQPEQGRRRHPGGFSRAPHRARAAPSERTPFGPYILPRCPRDPPPSPIFFPDEKLEALLPYLPLSLVDDIDAARQEMYTLWDVATAVMERVKVDGEPAAALRRGRVRVGVDDDQVARRDLSREAGTKAAESGVDARRCMVPVVDIMNHECSPVKDRWRNAPFHRAPPSSSRLATELSRGEPPGR